VHLGRWRSSSCDSFACLIFNSLIYFVYAAAHPVNAYDGLCTHVDVGIGARFCEDHAFL